MKPYLLPLSLSLALALTVALSLSVGSAPVPVLGGLADWLAGETTSAALIMGEIRLPRTALAALVGASLGLAGAALQGLLRNPLADPSLTGAAPGAALGAAFVFYYHLFPAAGELAPALAGMVGAALTLFFMLALAGRSPRAATLIMAGLAVSSIAGAALAAVLNFAPNPFAMQELVFWLLGSVAERGNRHLYFLLPAFVAGLALLWPQRRLLAALTLGEDCAQSLGLNVTRASRLIIIGVALLLGASVAVAGNIGFVGLVVPHMLRPFVAHRPDRLLVPSALGGAILVVAADIVVRHLPAMQELRLGVLTSFIGAPFFLWLIRKYRE